MQQTKITTSKSFSGKTHETFLVTLQGHENKKDVLKKVFSTNSSIVHQETLTLEPWESLHFCHQESSDYLVILRFDARRIYFDKIEKRHPFRYIQLGPVPGSDPMQMKFLGNVLFYFAKQREKVSLFQIDFDAAEPTAERCPIEMFDVNLQYAIVGSSFQDFTCFMVNRSSKVFSLKWTSDFEDENYMKLSHINAKNERIVFIDSHGRDIVVVSQDKLNRNSVATIKIATFTYDLGDSMPRMQGTMTLEDYPAPVGFKLGEDGFLMINHKNTLKKVDVFGLTSPERFDSISIKSEFSSFFFSTAKLRGITFSWTKNSQIGEHTIGIYNRFGQMSQEIRTGLPCHEGQDPPKIMFDGSVFFVISTSPVFEVKIFPFD